MKKKKEISVRKCERCKDTLLGKRNIFIICSGCMNILEKEAREWQQGKFSPVVPLHNIGA